MSEQITNYKCPSCYAPLRYDGATDRLKCDYCGMSYDTASIEAAYADKNADAVKAAEAEQEKANSESVDGWDLDGAPERWDETTADGLKVYNCPSCGAELICDDTTAATSCPYCDNPTIVPASLTGALKPDCVIPFKLDKEQAKSAFREHMKGKKLLPKLFSEENHLDEIKGIYVPFWLFDAEADADIVYSGTKVSTWSDAEYNYTERQIFDLVRGGSLEFNNVPVDGSEKMADELMESIEPFDMSQAVDFKTAYLTGFYADKYDVEAKDCVTRANARMQQSVKDIFLSTTAGYGEVVPKASHIRVQKGAARYALLPVWILNTTWRGEKYVFAMNGQTGKFVGNLPCDKSLARKWQLIYTGIFAAALLAVELLAFLL